MILPFPITIINVDIYAKMLESVLLRPLQEI